MARNVPDASSVIVAGARTPIGRFHGGLSTIPAAELGAIAIAAAVERSGIPPVAIGYVVMGHVVTAGAGQNPARIAAAGAGLPMNVPAVTVNNVCLSGMNSIVLADQLIRSGDYDIVVAGGMESMSQAPHLLPSAFSYGGVMVHDSLERDGLWDHFTNQSMGALTDAANAGESRVSRTDQDAFAVESHRRAAAAWEQGVFADEVVPVVVPRRRGGEDVIQQDEGLRADTSIESLAALRPAFRPDGTVTAGSSSPLSDGAAAVVVASRRAAERLGLTWLAEIVAHATVAGPDSTLQYQPANAIENRLQSRWSATGRAGSGGDQRGFRGGRHRQHQKARHRPRAGERRRRSARARAPAGYVRHPHQPAPGTGVGPTRWRGGRRRTVRRRRTG